MWDSEVVVTGAAQTPFNRRKDGSGPRDWAVSAFEAARDMAQIEASEIDALFIASESDFFSLQLNPSSVLATDLGLSGVAAVRCEAGGASGQAAVHQAALAVQSGLVQHAAVIGLDASASGLPPDKIKTLYGFSFDAWTDGLTGLTSTALYALSWQAFATQHGLGARHLNDVTRHNREQACSNPDAHLPRRDSADEIDASPLIASPYRRLHCSPLSDGAAALVLSHGSSTAPRATAPRLVGIGAATDHLHLGARAEPGHFAAKQAAMRRACTVAGITPADIGYAEVYDAYAGAQVQALAALGLSEAIEADLAAGVFTKGGRCPVNLSGGLMGQGAPAGAIGVAQTATCARMLEGRYHPALQLADLPAYALADTHGGVCTSAAVTLLKRGEAL